MYPTDAGLRQRPHGKTESMFALSHGELAIVIFIFALVWGAQALPRFAARIGEMTARNEARRPRRGG